MLNDDYYSIDFPGGSFYYGYECSYCHDCKEWLPSGREYCDKDELHKTSWGFHGKIIATTGEYCLFDVLMWMPFGSILEDKE